MEKPWMASLVDALQAPPTKNAATEEPAPEEPEFDDTASERPSVSAPVSDSFVSAHSSHWAQPTKSPLEYEGSTYWNESWLERILVHAPAITVVVLFAFVLGALSFFYRTQIGHSLIRLGEKISGDPSPVSAISAPKANAPTIQSPAPPMQSGLSQPSPSSDLSAANAGTAARTPAVLPKNSAAPPNENLNDRAASSSRGDLERASAQKLPPQTSSDIDDGQADFQIADTFLHQARTPEARAKAAGLLWAAVAKGSSDAEIELADVYGRGEGVRKNCQQARILLAAARDKHNPLAGTESDELRVYGCR